MLAQHGATEVHAYATHGILTNPACERISKCEALKEVVVTDSLPVENLLPQCSKLRVISLANLLAEAVLRIHTGESMEHVRQQQPAFSDSAEASYCTPPTMTKPDPEADRFPA